MKKKSKVLLIIPAYNEEKNILNTTKEIEKYNQTSKFKLDYIVINDGSLDNTEAILTKNKIPHITLLENLGIGGAVQTGYKYANQNNYDIAVQFDGDGQHNVQYVYNIINPIINKRANMVVGSRFIDENKSDFKPDFKHTLGINLISRTIKLRTGKKIFDTTSGFRAVDKDLIAFFAKHYPQEYPEPISTVDAIFHDKIVEEVAVSMNVRKNGTSSITSWKTLYYMFNVIMTILMRRK